MQVSSLENSKRLFELSGWQNTRDFWYKTPKIDLRSGSAIDDYSHWKVKPLGYRGKYSTSHPAYDAGYLLRKLQEAVSLSCYDSEWRAAYGKEDGIYADTPEDALALLAIKLFEEGVLTND